MRRRRGFGFCGFRRWLGWWGISEYPGAGLGGWRVRRMGLWWMLRGSEVEVGGGDGGACHWAGDLVGLCSGEGDGGAGRIVVDRATGQTSNAKYFAGGIVRMGVGRWWMGWRMGRGRGWGLRLGSLERSLRHGDFAPMDGGCCSSHCGSTVPMAGLQEEAERVAFSHGGTSWKRISYCASDPVLAFSSQCAELRRRSQSDRIA